MPPPKAKAKAKAQAKAAPENPLEQQWSVALRHEVNRSKGLEAVSSWREYRCTTATAINFMPERHTKIVLGRPVQVLMLGPEWKTVSQVCVRLVVVSSASTGVLIFS